ncbi:MAG: DUF3098 domain-containing protein [Bacteroidetes bacterium]|nr:DUF3098 domain-containing protein [Bacteroidota bacterium]
MADNNNSKAEFQFVRENYIMMIIGILVIIFGFVLMSGGKSVDPNVFDETKVYSFRRITIAPILVIAGFIIEIVAIFRKNKSHDQPES